MAALHSPAQRATASAAPATVLGSPLGGATAGPGMLPTGQRAAGIKQQHQNGPKEVQAGLLLAPQHQWGWGVWEGGPHRCMFAAGGTDQGHRCVREVGQCCGGYHSEVSRGRPTKRLRFGDVRPQWHWKGRSLLCLISHVVMEKWDAEVGGGDCGPQFTAIFRNLTAIYRNFTTIYRHFTAIYRNFIAIYRDFSQITAILRNFPRFTAFFSACVCVWGGGSQPPPPMLNGMQHNVGGNRNSGTQLNMWFWWVWNGELFAVDRKMARSTCA